MNGAIPRDEVFSEPIAAADLREGEKFSHVLLRHLRETDGGIGLSYGHEAAYVLPANSPRIYLVEADLFAYNATSKRLQCVTKGSRFAGLPEPEFLYHYVDSEGVEGYYTGGLNRVSFLHEGGVYFAGANVNAVAGAIHRERLFVVSDYRLTYSPALTRAYLSNSAQDPDMAGAIDFLHDDGKLLGIVPFRDRLYIFRERGLLRVRADGEALNFKVEAIPYGCGAIVHGSLRVCGERIAFFTENGFYTFDGSDYHRIWDSAFEEIDFTAEKSWESGFFRDSYFALVTLKDGTASLLCYDFARKRASFVLGDPLSFSVGRDAAISCADMNVYFLTDSGLPVGDAACTLDLTIPRRKACALDGLKMCGKGTFTLTVACGDKSRTYEGEAERAIVFPSPLFGEIKLHFETRDKAFTLSSLHLIWRKYDD